MAEENVFTKARSFDIRVSLKKIADKQIKIGKYLRYYKGKHEMNFSSEKYYNQFADRLRNFCDNLCRTVVKAPTDRLEVTGFSDKNDTALYTSSWDVWTYSEMPKMSKRTHRDAFKTGDAYVVVWADETGKARIYPQDPKNCAVWYDGETGKIARGAKVWRGLDKFVYLTLYYPDRIEKYVTQNPQAEGHTPVSAQAFTARNVEGENWPLENPIGTCAMFHFGLENSILDDVIPLNDALNKEVCDLLVGSEANSLRQRYVTGIQYETDPESGKQIIPFSRDSQYVASSKELAKFGEFTDVSLTEFLGVCNDLRMEIARVSGIPAYYFMLEKGGFPSGEALTKAESRFTAMITEAQLDFGPTWSNVTKFALLIENQTEAAAKIEAQWRPAAPMSETEKLNVAVMKKQVGVSTEQILSELGYTDADIKRMAGENAAAQAAAADAFSKTFDAGASIVGG